MAAQRKKGTRKSTKRTTNKSNRTYYAISAFVMIVLMVLTVFQLGIVGEYIDSFFAYFVGTSRYFTYLIIILLSVYLATEQKFPFTRRMGGYLLLQFGLLFLFHSLLYLTNRERIEQFYSFDEIVTGVQAAEGMAFLGGGVIGQILFNFSSTGVSLLGTLLLSVIFIYLSILVIADKNVENTLSADFSRISKVLKAIGTALLALFSKGADTTQNLFKGRTGQKQGTASKSGGTKEKSTPVKDDAKDDAKGSSPAHVSDFPEDDTIIEDMHAYDRDDEDEKEESKSAAPDSAGGSTEAGSGQHAVQADDTGPEIDTSEGEVQPLEYETEGEEAAVMESSGEGDDSEVEMLDDEEIAELKKYELPPMKMLKDAEVSEKVSNDEVLKQGRILEETLNNFGVKAKVSKIRIGPAVTQFEIQPDIGVKVSKIINLQNDIALSLAAKDLRIEAPIPGKSAVGIEVPNSVVSMVTLREVVKRRNTDNPLEVALGKDISGAPITAELNKMPHLLVAGSTGSGKSVCINGIIISILMNAKPHEVKLMMIDPKMVELNGYNGIPHLLSPVVTNPQKANDALNRIVSEMERRYDLFSHSSTRNIEAYNQYLERESEEPEKVQKLPYIVVIIDELADLMLVASKEVEASITRIAQMARAAGIHLIIATQRPSVDVITGIIKANIPSRIAFSVSSQTDSRTIMDSMGAEKLLGKGDMLFMPSGRSKPIRVQGAFLSDNEVYDVVDYITGQMKANYEKSIMNKQPKKEEVESEDELYPDAKWFVIEEQRASASLLQRQFRVGYNRAARLVDDLEANGVIGPASGSKPRSVIIQNEE